MDEYVNKDFLLTNDAGRELYHGYAADMPIFDYHNHFNPREIAEDARFENLTHIWLHGDHYKWRAMRTRGVDERYITGNASDYEKFAAWAETVPYTMGNVLYPWTHMELKNPFGISHLLLGPDTAEEVWKTTGELLRQEGFSVCDIVRRMNVRVMCTTDDPTDTLEWHRVIRQKYTDFRVLPTFRPDAALAIEDPGLWNAYRLKLAGSADLPIDSFTALVEALDRRHAFFHEMGGRATDHAIVAPFADEAAPDALEAIFRKLVDSSVPSPGETRQFKTALLREVGRMNHRRGWVMQLHMSAQRNNSSRGFAALGGNAGYNSISDQPVSAPLARFLDLLDRTDELPKTVLYSLNGQQNDILATMAGNFMDGRVVGKLQLGAAWWFNDQKDGIERHLISMANMGLISTFIGMLTDSVSVFSFIRHEYFRRIICNLMGQWVEDGDLPGDIRHIGGIVQDICFTNALRFFDVDGEE